MEQDRKPILERKIITERDEEDEARDGDEDDDDDDDNDNDDKVEPGMRSDRAKTKRSFRRVLTEKVPLRVHDVVIKGNTKSKDSLIERELEPLKHAASLPELVQAAGVVNERFRRLEVFDSVTITLDSGPPEFPGTAIVVVEVVESKNGFTGDIGVFLRPQARFRLLEGSFKLKNLFGHGDVWKGSLSYGWDQMAEVCAGVSVPRCKGWITPFRAQVSLLSQNWMNFSSNLRQALGLSLGLISSQNHDLAYNLYWRSFKDPSQLPSRSRPVIPWLEHGFLSSLNYTYRIGSNSMNSSSRLTHGYALVSNSQIGGIIPDYWRLRFFHQEFDLRYALPLGLYRTALNFGISGSVTFPWGSGSLNKPSSISEKFFLGGNSLSVCSLGASMSGLGYESRGLGLAKPICESANYKGSGTGLGKGFLGRDIAVAAFTDISFDLPFGVSRNAVAYGHAFACTGSLTRLTENTMQDFSFHKFQESLRCSAGFGIIVPTKLFRMEVYYCYMFKQHEQDRGKSGFKFGFSSPL